jgi:DeoR/GlpR family transcriptional regulator of sugar metabolism
LPEDAGRGDVFARERQEHIARIVEEHGRARVADLAARFDVSTVTIRKDLAVLEGEGRLLRTHGGAMGPLADRPELGFDIRARLQPEAKGRIGAIAAGLVVDGESIALDASTTALAMARHIKARGPWIHLTVVTNGLRIAFELAGHPGVTVVLPGGFLRWEALSVVGPLGEGLFGKVNIQKAFMGAAGFTIPTGLSDATDEEAQIKRLIAGSAHEVIALVDHTKFGRAAFATFCRTDDLGAVVTDDLAPEAMLDSLRDLGVGVHVARDETPRPTVPSRTGSSEAREATS